MSKIKPVTVLVYIIAIWHGYALIAHPLIFHGARLPLSSWVAGYTDSLMITEAWNYFYKPPQWRVKVEYTVTGDPQNKVHKFFSSSPDYFEQRRFFRCGACARASFQFYRGTQLPNQKWLIGHYLCALHASTDEIQAVVSEAPYNSDEFKKVRSQEIACIDYQ